MLNAFMLHRVYCNNKVKDESFAGKVHNVPSVWICFHCYLPMHSIYKSCVSESHWVAVSNMRVAGDGIFRESTCIFDSLCNTLYYLRHNEARLLRPVSNNMRFDVMNTQMQENSHDCGLFAVAYAAELVYGKVPYLAHFNTEMIRSHLIKCLEGHEMERFPLKRERRIGFGRRVKISSTVDIYCTCRMPSNKNLPMVLCSTWFHKKCIAECVSDNPKEKWFCSKCQSLLQ